MNYNKVFVVITGGTALANIGESGKGISLKQDIIFLDLKFKTVSGIEYITKEKYNQTFENIIFTRPLNILSENLTIKDLEVLTEHLLLLDSYSPLAIIIIHGTDRLCFSAAYVSLVFNRPYPILFISCQRSLDRPTSELNLALHNALLISTKIKSGTWVLNYKTPEICEVINPKYALKLFSYNKSCFVSKIGKPCFIFSNVSNKLIKLSQSKSYFKSYIKTKGTLELPKILALTLFPNSALPDLTKYNYVIICGTGLGNISNQHISYLSKSKVYVTSVPIGPTRNDIYETSRNLLLNKIKQSEYSLDYLYLKLLTKSWITK